MVNLKKSRSGSAPMISNFAARGSQARTEELVALCQDLYGHTLRGCVSIRLTSVRL